MYLASGLGILLAGIALAWFVDRLPGSRRPAQRSWRHLWSGDRGAVLLLTAVTLLFFWPVLLAGYVFPKGGGDLWGQLYPVWRFVAEQLRHGVFPLWDPLLMAGDPILSEAQYGIFNPLNWSLFLTPSLPTQLVLWRGMVNVLLAGVGMYLFLTRSPGLHLRVAAGLLGAIAYMLADPFVIHLGHPQINDAMAWLPWCLLAVDWALSVTEGHRVALAGIPVALMILAGHGQMALYGLIALALYGLWRAWTLSAEETTAGRKRRTILHRLARLTLVACIGFALSAPVLLPSIERMPWTNRSLVPDDQRHGYEFHPVLLVDSLAPHIHGRGADGWWPALDRVETGYVGAITLFLAVLGLTTQRRRAGFWIILGVSAFVFALGYQTPLYSSLAGLPFFADLWKTARAIYLLALTVAVLGALGLQTLLEGQDEERERIWRWALVVGGIVLWILTPYLLRQVPDGQPYQRAASNLRLAAALAVCVAGLAWAWRRWHHKWALGGIVLLLVIELIALSALAETDPSPPLSESAQDHPSALAFLRSDPGWFRVDSQGEARHIWSPETLQIQGFETLQGSGNPLSLWPFEQFYWAQPTKDAPGYALLGAKYIIMPKDDLPPGQDIWPVFTDDPLIDVHLNTRALPRAWLVYRTEPVKDYGEARRYIQTPGFHPELVATVEDGPRLDDQGTGGIEVLYYDPNHMGFVIHTDAPALMVLSDVFYPGWKGYVDGAQVPIYRANATFRGMIVPAGDHEVHMVFQPRSFSIGLALAVLGLFVLLVAALPNTIIHKLLTRRK